MNQGDVIILFVLFGLKFFSYYEFSTNVIQVVDSKKTFLVDLLFIQHHRFRNIRHQGFCVTAHLDLSVYVQLSLYSGTGNFFVFRIVLNCQIELIGEVVGPA